MSSVSLLATEVLRQLDIKEAKVKADYAESLGDLADEMYDSYCFYKQKRWARWFEEKLIIYDSREQKVDDLLDRGPVFAYVDKKESYSIFGSELYAKRWMRIRNYNSQIDSIDNLRAMAENSIKNGTAVVVLSSPDYAWLYC